MPLVPISNLKSTRESLCYAQSIVGKYYVNWNDTEAQQKQERTVKSLQGLIDEIDILRPLGPNGKHGDRHTPYCGCEINCKHCGEPIQLFRSFGVSWIHIHPDGKQKWYGLNCEGKTGIGEIAEPPSWTMTDIVKAMIP